MTPVPAPAPRPGPQSAIPPPPPPAPRSVAPRIPVQPCQPPQRRVIIVSGGGGNKLFTLLVALIVIAGGAFGFYAYKTRDARNTEIVVYRDEEPLPATPDEPLPEIKFDPVKDAPPPQGEEPPDDDAGDGTRNPFVDDDLDRAAPVPALASEKPAAKPKPAGPPKPVKLIRKWIPNLGQDVDYKYSRSDIVDILVLYAPQVRERLGSHQAVLNHVNHVIAYTNQQIKGREQKGVKGHMGRLRLAGLVEVDYVTTGTTKGDLGNLMGGRIKSGQDNSHKLRNYVKADLVTILGAFNKRGGGGLASLHGPWSAMNYPVGSIFAHEMRHNFGWNHQDKHNYSMIQRNYRGMANWMRNTRGGDKIYVQYKGTGDEFETANAAAGAATGGAAAGGKK